MEQTPRFQEIDLTPRELSEELNGREIGDEITTQEAKAVKAAGLVVVYGASDDLIEFEGAISDEYGASEGSIFKIDAGGVFPDFDGGSVDHDDIDIMRDWFARERTPKGEITARWSNGEASWVYETSIPHATFDIFEDGDLYCRGIVFALTDAVTESAPAGGEDDPTPDADATYAAVCSSWHESHADRQMPWRVAVTILAIVKKLPREEIAALMALDD